MPLALKYICWSSVYSILAYIELSILYTKLFIPAMVDREQNKSIGIAEKSSADMIHYVAICFTGIGDAFAWIGVLYSRDFEGNRWTRPHVSNPAPA